MIEGCASLILLQRALGIFRKVATPKNPLSGPGWHTPARPPRTVQWWLTLQGNTDQSDPKHTDTLVPKPLHPFLLERTQTHTQMLLRTVLKLTLKCSSWMPLMTLLSKVVLLTPTYTFQMSLYVWRENYYQSSVKLLQMVHCKTEYLWLAFTEFHNH